MNHLIQSLEPRRHFAVFNGTPGADTIVAYVDPNGISHVVVNGVDQMTFDHQLDIYGHGGNDFIDVRAVQGLTLASITPGEGENTIYVGDGDFDTKIQGWVQVLGHLGQDRIVVYDHADGSNDFDYYELTSSAFRKPTSSTARLDFYSVETFDVHGSPQSDAIKIISTAPNTFTTWRSGNGDDVVFVGDGDLGLLKGSLQVSTEGGNDQVILYDYASPGPHTYDVFNQTIERAGFGYFDMNSAESFVLSASAGDDVINLYTGAGAIAPVAVYGKAGNDTINVHTYWYDNPAPQKPVYIDGSEGDDTINFNTRAAADRYIVRPTEITGDLLPVFHYSTSESLNLIGRAEDEHFVIEGTRAGVSTAVHAGDGDDSVWMGGVFATTNLDLIQGPVTVNGGAGEDVIEAFDSTQPLARTFAFTDSMLTRTEMADVSYAATERVVVHAGAAFDTFNVKTTSDGPKLFLLGGGSPDRFNINETAPGPDGAVWIDGGAGMDLVNVNTDGEGVAAAARFVSWQDLGSLTIGGGGLVTLDDPYSDSVIITRDLQIAPMGRLDLGDDAMVIDYANNDDSPADVVRGWLASGRNGGTWNGATGIVSSVAAANPGRAIGWAEADDLHPNIPSPFPHTGPGALLLRYTILGDADLDGSVSLTDFNRLAGSFGLSNRPWLDGDFNYDGNVNLTDFNLLASNFGQSVTTFTRLDPSDEHAEPSLHE